MTFLNAAGEKVDSNGKPLDQAKAEGTSEVDTLKQQVADLTSGHDKVLKEAKTLSERLKEAKAESTAEVSALKSQVTDLTKQLKAAQTKPALPEDAKQRLAGVEGIDEALAAKALAALAAK
jgi:predicted  nucleic acid-binding Zn-ribbon protein